MARIQEILILIFVLFIIQLHAAKPLPPPDENEGPKGNATAGGEEEAELRGLKGMANPLANLQKGALKCKVEGTYAIKGECSKYIECRKKGKVPQTKYCPTGKFFDFVKRACVKSGDARCRGDVCAENEILADPMDDNGFLRCEHGVPMPHTCPDGENYIAAQKQCSGGQKVDGVNFELSL